MTHAEPVSGSRLTTIGLAGRHAKVFAVAMRFCATVMVQVAFYRMLGRRERGFIVLGQGLADACGRLGGAFTKIGQILSTRADLFPPAALEALAVLQDRVPPAPYSSVRPIILGCRYPLEAVHETPIASGSIAQVHLAVDGRTKRKVILKVKRPGITEQMLADVASFAFFAQLASKVPLFSHLPLAASAGQICKTLLAQTDFLAECVRQQEFANAFRDIENVRVANVIPEACDENLIVMEYLDGFVPLTSHPADHARVTACTTGLRALFRMLFEVGLIHGDMHGGNVLANGDGSQVGLLDFGYAIEISSQTRRHFANFFLAIARANGGKAAAVLRETALRLPEPFDPDAFEADVRRLVEDSAGKRADQFQVTRFGVELFRIQRRHGVFGSADFTLPILALLAYEGLVKTVAPRLDFQKEAVPYILRGLN